MGNKNPSFCDFLVLLAQALRPSPSLGACSEVRRGQSPLKWDGISTKIGRPTPIDLLKKPMVLQKSAKSQAFKKVKMPKNTCKQNQVRATFKTYIS